MTLRKLAVLTALLLAVPTLSFAAPAEETSPPALDWTCPLQSASSAPETAQAPGTARQDAGSDSGAAFTSCSSICYSEYYSCKLDCRFTPYPGCLQDCQAELQQCLAGC